MALSSKERKELKARAHHLKPVIRIGQKGITESLVLETEQSLDTHELIKVHIAGESGSECKASGLELARQSHAEVVAHIGKTTILYRKQQTQP